MTPGSDQERKCDRVRKHRNDADPNGGLGPGSAQLRSNEAYVPRHGDLRYGVESYAIDADIKLSGNHLRATTELRCRAHTDIDTVVLDLHAPLAVRTLTVNGRATKYARKNHRLAVTLPAEAGAGEPFVVSVTYSGNPRQMRGPDGLAGWEELEDGLLVTSQPHGSPTWFPCNDHPGDKARYTFRITTDNDYQVIANGRLTGRRRRSSRTTWCYEQDEPMATYLATLQVGRYVTRRFDTAPGEPPLHVHHPRHLRRQVETGPMARQAQIMAVFERAYGPYPFTGYSAVITADELEIPLEAQTLSIFGPNFLAPGWENERLVAHELAHQWFGNSLTLANWRDIWLHEGFACYSEWLWSEASGGETADEHARHHLRDMTRGTPLRVIGRALQEDFPLADPGPELMFDDRVYKRGAFTLAALRAEVGDETFFDVLRTWCTEHSHGSVTTEDFISHVTAATTLDASWFEPWLYTEELPTGW